VSRRRRVTVLLRKREPRNRHIQGGKQDADRSGPAEVTRVNWASSELIPFRHNADAVALEGGDQQWGRRMNRAKAGGPYGTWDLCTLYVGGV